MALALAPRGVLLNRKFFLPITKGLIERSLRNPKLWITEFIPRNIKSLGSIENPRRSWDFCLNREDYVYTSLRRRILMVKLRGGLP